MVNPPKFKMKLLLIHLLNLVSVCNSNEKRVIWGFVNEYDHL